MFGGQAGAEALGGRTRGHAERAIPEIPPVGPAEQRDGERRIGVFQPRRGLPERGRAEQHEQDRDLQSVVEGTRVSVRLDRGGRRRQTNKTSNTHNTTTSTPKPTLTPILQT